MLITLASRLAHNQMQLWEFLNNALRECACRRFMAFLINQSSFTHCFGPVLAHKHSCVKYHESFGKRISGMLFCNKRFSGI